MAHDGASWNVDGMSLKAVRVSARVPQNLVALMEIRRREEHYKSLSSYILSLVLFDVAVRRKHKLTSQAVNDSPEALDAVVAQLVADFAKEKREPSTWLTARLEELLAERLADEAKVKKIAKENARVP